MKIKSNIGKYNLVDKDIDQNILRMLKQKYKWSCIEN